MAMREPRSSADSDSGAAPESEGRHVMRAMARGVSSRCPACGRGSLFRAYLKPRDACPACGEALHHQRADDAPPYVTILVVGHLVVALAVAIDLALAWPSWVNVLVCLAVTAGLSLVLLPRIKGALIGLQWALRMHGFGVRPDAPARL